MKFELLLFTTLAVASASLCRGYKIEGKVLVSGVKVSTYSTETRVLVQGAGGKTSVGFLQNDGRFVVSGLPAGLYIVEVASSNYFFDRARVEISTGGKVKAKKDHPLQPSTGAQLHYPLKFNAKETMTFFTPRETWSLKDVLMQPMILIMVLPILLMLCLPKMLGNIDPEAQRQMQEDVPSIFNQSQEMPYELTDVFQYMFPERKGKKPSATKKSVTAPRKR
ncbi:endoplasmic reticulum membrane protein complex subunit 7-like [Sycon ciliatum]|uniref:endoplasmic reticulum membrane protein complex subunit 7-like n=1 Tax=Sycon ciliatum TaxID=27933 RepID=UPI0020A99E62|eukprot:scpid94486/ scgid12068/ UPF0480 protein C15orf24 homolog